MTNDKKKTKDFKKGKIKQPVGQNVKKLKNKNKRKTTICGRI